MNWLSFRGEVARELESNILPFWRNHLVTPEGDFFGKIDNDNKAEEAPLGLVMLARLLWTYSDAFRMLGKSEDRAMAEKARTALFKHLKDQAHGGFFWSADRKTGPVETRKVLYGQAFALYGLSAWQQIAPSEENSVFCQDLFRIIEQHSRDEEFGGYLEAREADWSGDGSNNLGSEDLVCFKSMNTNLHILEAYTRYQEVFPSESGAKALGSLIDTVMEKIYNPKRKHQELYFDRDWTPEARVISSFGHDVETSWLLQEALEVLEDETRIRKYRTEILDLLDTSIKEGAASDGSLYNEEENKHIDPTRVWWVQAEYAVSLMNAWQMTGKEDYLDRLQRIWLFILQHQVCPRGEWYAELNEDCKPKNDPKGGMWKTPYHNGRACMELLRRMDKIKES